MYLLNKFLYEVSELSQNILIFAIFEIILQAFILKTDNSIGDN